MKPKILLIDDIKYEPNATDIARTFGEGIHCLIAGRPWDILILDHDLGEDRTGYDIAKFLLENPKYAPKEIYCCSFNPVGRKNIEALIPKIMERKEADGY